MITINAGPRRRARRKRFGFDAIWRLCEQIGVFMEANGLQGGTSYIALGGGTPDLYVVTQAVAFDFELGDRLSEFAAPYIERGLLGGASLIPASSPEELAAFFDLGKVIRVASGT